MSESECESGFMHTQYSQRQLDAMHVTARRLTLRAFWWSQSPHKVAGVNVKRGGHLEDVVQCEVATSPLYLPKERPVHVAIGGKLLLGLAQLHTTLADARTELGGGRRDRRRGG